MKEDSYFPNEHRFLCEEVFSDCINAEISVRRLPGVLYYEEEFVIRHDVNGKRITEFTPVKEVDGWPLPKGCVDHHGNNYYKLRGSEGVLNSFYNSKPK